MLFTIIESFSPNDGDRWTSYCKWNTEDDSLIINCPNEEIWQELSQQPEKMAQLNQKVNRLILKYANYPELIFDRENRDRYLT